MNLRCLASLFVLLLTRSTETTAYVLQLPQAFGRVARTSRTFLTAVSNVDVPAKYSFIQSELRNAAMRLHTKKQAPKEGQVEVTTPTTPYVPTHEDYLHFLVDSQHVYRAMEDIVNHSDELAAFRNTGLERVQALEQDIRFMVREYGLERPSVGTPGREYAQLLHQVSKTSIPAFMCHYYNFYFAHTAGGRMIGKQMSALLLNKKTLEFYKVRYIFCVDSSISILSKRMQFSYSVGVDIPWKQWDRDLNEIKDAVKENIEQMAAQWMAAEKNACVEETNAAFQGGGAINSYLSGGGR
jgi:heme oxygenase (biliverdin-producing, ferredoxin)